MPHRYQLSRKRGARMPDHCRSVARPSRFSNPFRIVKMPHRKYRVVLPQDLHDPVIYDIYFTHTRPSPVSRIEAHRQAVACFKELMKQRRLPEADLQRIRGKHLACYCPLHLPCHADILLEIANS